VTFKRSLSSVGAQHWTLQHNAVRLRQSELWLALGDAEYVREVRAPQLLPAWRAALSGAAAA